MSDKIKTRESIKDIKVLDKSSNIADKMKNAYIRTKDEAQQTQKSEHNSPSEYATDNVDRGVEKAIYGTGHQVKRQTGKIVDKTKDTHKAKKQADSMSDPIRDQAKKYTQQNIYQSSQSTEQALNKSVKTAQKVDRSIKHSAKGTKKTTQRSVKTAKQTAKATIKTTQQTAKAAVKTAQATVKASKVSAQVARATAKATVKTTKAAVKVTIAAVKATIATIKGLISAIAAGGWIAVVIIIVICMAALIFSSCFGIFFSSDDTGNGSPTMSHVVESLNQEFTEKIEEIKNNNPHDTLKINNTDSDATVSNWHDILAIYAVKATTDPGNPDEVATLDDNKIKILRNIFWDINIITYTTETVKHEDPITTTDENGNEVTKTVITTETVLNINIASKPYPEMAIQYGFNTEQKEQLAELMKPEYQELFSLLMSSE
jgi:hypothetical protein